MPSQSRFFQKNIKACNPYREFWEFLEWLARRRQYPDPMQILDPLNVLKRTPHVKPMKFPGTAQKNVAHRFPGQEDNPERVNAFKRK